jgi:hypothetical protein
MQASIRLLKVLPDLSSTGLIRCQIWHDDIHAKYDCLSYVWGSDGDGNLILLNGEEHAIRQILCDFLGVARTQYTYAGQSVPSGSTLSVHEDKNRGVRT